MKKAIQPPKESKVKQALLGLYGIIGVAVSTFGPFKVPFAESHAKEYWRHAVLGLILVFGIVIGIISLALYMFDANYFKSQMVDYVKTHHQRDLTLEGDIRITFFPKLGLDAGKMSVSQRNSGKNFASVENAHFYIAWWPLFLKQLQIESAALSGVHANIVRHKNGSSSLDDLLGPEGSMGDIKFEIDSVKVANSSFNLQDETSGIFLALHDFSMETGKLSDSTPGKVTASFRLESNKPHIDTKVKLNSHVLFELKSNHFEFANFDAEFDGEMAGISNLNMNLQGSLNSYPALQQYTADKLLANLKGKLDNRKLDAKIDLPKLELKKGKLNGSSLNISATLLQEGESLTASLEAPAFDLSESKLNSASITANFDLFKAGRSMQGKLNSPFSMDMGTLQLQLPAIVSSLSAANPLLSGKLNASVNGNLQADISAQNINLLFKAKIDESNLSGNIALHNLAQPAYSFDVGVNTLDLDRYLATDWSKRLLDDAAPFDLSGLKNLNLRGKLRSNEFKFAKLKASNLVADIKAEPAALQIDVGNARLYGGTTNASLIIASDDTPRFTLKQTLNNVQLNALLTDFNGSEAKLAGKGNLSYDLNASGINMGALRKSLSGSASLALNRGSLAGTNLGDALLAGKDQLGLTGSERSEPAKFTETTAYSELKASFNISEGKAHSGDLLLKSPLFSSKGEGDIALEKGQLNFRLNTTVASGLKRNSNGELADLKGVSIPLRISGPYAAPILSLEFGNASGMKGTKPLKTAEAKPAPAPAKTGKAAKK